MSIRKNSWLVIVGLISFFLLNPSHARSQERIIRAIKAVHNKFIRTVTHPDFVALLDYTASYMHVYYDASYDAVFWQINANRDSTIPQINASLHGRSNVYNIHYYKNMARLAMLLKGYCVGISLIHIKDGRLDWKRLLRRELGMMPAMMTAWQFRYKYCRYKNIWDTSEARNGTRYVIPFPTGDIKIALKGWQVSAANIGELSISGYFMGRDVYEDFQAKKQKLNENRALHHTWQLRSKRFNWSELLCQSE
jgi:hypothetical protein